MLPGLRHRQLGKGGGVTINDEHFAAGIAGRQHAKAANVIGRVHPQGLIRQSHSRNRMVESQAGDIFVRLGEAWHQDEMRRDIQGVQQRIEQICLVLAIAKLVLQHIRRSMRTERIHPQGNGDIAQSAHIIIRCRHLIAVAFRAARQLAGLLSELGRHLVSQFADPSVPFRKRRPIGKRGNQ